MDEQSLGRRQYLQHYKHIISQIFSQKMTHNVGFISSVGETIPQFTINNQQDN